MREHIAKSCGHAAAVFCAVSGEESCSYILHINNSY